MIFEFINYDKQWSYLFLSQSISKFFPFPLPSTTSALHFNFALERDPKNIFYYQHDVIQTKSSIFYYLADTNIHTHNLLVCNSGQCTTFMLWIYVTLSLFFRNFFFFYWGREWSLNRQHSVHPLPLFAGGEAWTSYQIFKKVFTGP